MAPDPSVVPIVDLSPWRAGSPADRQRLVDEVTGICHDIGLFLVTGHGIDPAFMADLFAMTERLFALPDAAKATFDKTRSPHFRGWEGEGSEYTNGRPDIREQVDLWTEHRARPATVQPPYLRLLGPNQWPAEELLPGSWPLVDDWFARAGRLADEILGILSVGLDLDEGAIRARFAGEQMSLTKLITYPPTPEGGAGVNAHHDAGFLTVLAPGPTAGLQAQTPDGNWVPVPSIPDTFVINLGEMLQALSANYFVATPHRVITTERRYAIGYFHGPALDTTLDPLPLDDHYHRAVASSPRHAGARYMARRDETAAGVGDMQSAHRPDTYGEQLWNYFTRSYPDNVARHHPDVAL